MIFPTITTRQHPEATAANLPLYTDWAYDAENNCLALRGGRQYKVSGADALKIWIAKALKTARGAFPMYSHEYGQDFLRHLRENNLPALDEQLTACVKDALLVNPYITGVRGFVFSHTVNAVRAAFTVDTVYGEVVAREEVRRV